MAGTLFGALLIISDLMVGATFARRDYRQRFVRSREISAPLHFTQLPAAPSVFDGPALMERFVVSRARHVEMNRCQCFAFMAFKKAAFSGCRER